MLSVIDKTESESNQISIFLVRIDYEAAHFKSLKLLKGKIGFCKVIMIILYKDAGIIWFKNDKP